MDIEAYTIKWLNKRGLSAEAFPYPPKNRPERLITVERVGGRSDGFIDHPMVAVQSWAKTKADAEALSREVDKELLRFFPDGAIITSCTRNSLAYFPSEKDEPRYQGTYQIIANIL